MSETGGDGSAAQAGEGGAAAPAASDAGAAGQGEQGVVVVVTAGACKEDATWSGPAPLDAISTDADESLLSITADELDIAFLRAGAPFVAHRSSAGVGFDTATAIALPDGYVASAGAALSGDGLILVLVSMDGQSFASLSRASRTDSFGATADPSAFAGLNARAVQTLEHYAAPVLSPDGKTFVFSGFIPGANGVAVVYESSWSASAWAMPNNLSYGLFEGTGDKRPLPSGLSSDSRTLFYFDEATSKEVARFRDRPDAPLYDTVDLGALQDAVPNTECNKLYYSSAGNVLTETN